MSNLDSMLKPNKDFAAQQSAAGTLMPSLPRAMPNVKAVIVGCADMRVDPAHRITPGLLEQLALLGRIGQVAGEIPGGVESFTWSYFSTPIAGSPALPATPTC
jgi:carbonic anhydrase